MCKAATYWGEADLVARCTHTGLPNHVDCCAALAIGTRGLPERSLADCPVGVAQMSSDAREDWKRRA